MVDPISLTLAAMQNDMAQMSAVANNAANALTPGFKRTFMAVSGAFAIEGNSPRSSPTAERPVLRAVTDSRAGTLRQTGNPFDLALLGGGFFEVMTPSGPAYTRQGAFRVDADGRLVTPSGHAVQGAVGEIVLSTPAPTIDRSGKVFEGGKQVAQIKVVDFDRADGLTAVGGGLLVAASDVRGNTLETPKMIQGQLENSNVDATREMVRMMETFRHFESSTRVLQAYDEVRDKAFRALGQF